MEHILIYQDPGRKTAGDAKLIEDLLSYMATPQYLRKRLFKLTPTLTYAGVLPPLRTPNHPTTKHSSELRPEDLREGVVVEARGGRCLVDIGVERPAELKGEHPIGGKVNVEVATITPHLQAHLKAPDAIPIYWGFRVRALEATLGEMVEVGRFDLKIATSRWGKPLEEVRADLERRWLASRKVLIAFGAPASGLKEILAREGKTLEGIFDYSVNTVRAQGADTVRTEEAIFTTLSALNLLIKD